MISLCLFRVMKISIVEVSGLALLVGTVIFLTLPWMLYIKLSRLTYFLLMNKVSGIRYCMSFIPRLPLLMNNSRICAKWFSTTPLMCVRSDLLIERRCSSSISMYASSMNIPSGYAAIYSRAASMVLVFNVNVHKVLSVGLDTVFFHWLFRPQLYVLLIHV